MLVAFFCTGTALAFFQSEENSPFIIQDLKIISKGFHNEWPQILIIRILISSGPYAISGFKFWIIYKILSWERSMDVSDWSVRDVKLFESSLLFCNIEHCSAKKESKSSTFWRKSIIKLPLWYSGGMIGIFLSFMKLFKMDQ